MVWDLAEVLVALGGNLPLNTVVVVVSSGGLVVGGGRGLLVCVSRFLQVNVNHHAEYCYLLLSTLGTSLSPVAILSLTGGRKLPCSTGKVTGWFPLSVLLHPGISR